MKILLQDGYGIKRDKLDVLAIYAMFCGSCNFDETIAKITKR